MSGEFRQCHTFYIENVGENVGGILLIHLNISASKCLRVSHKPNSTTTPSVFKRSQKKSEYFKIKEMTEMTKKLKK